MKAKELAKELLKNPEFEVEFREFHSSFFDGTNLLVFKDVQIDDVGYSSKLIILGGKKKE